MSANPIDQDRSEAKDVHDTYDSGNLQKVSAFFKFKRGTPETCCRRKYQRVRNFLLQMDQLDNKNPDHTELASLINLLAEADNITKNFIKTDSDALHTWLEKNPTIKALIKSPEATDADLEYIYTWIIGHIGGLCDHATATPANFDAVGGDCLC